MLAYIESRILALIEYGTVASLALLAANRPEGSGSAEAPSPVTHLHDQAAFIARDRLRHQKHADTA